MRALLILLLLSACSIESGAPDAGSPADDAPIAADAPGSAEDGGGESADAGFTGSGELLWWSEIVNSAWGQDIAVDLSGDIVVTGQFVDYVRFGTTQREGFGPTSEDVYLAKLSGADGTHLWSRVLGSTAPDGVYGVRVDTDGNIFLAGWFRGTADFGGAVLPSANPETDDIVVAKYDADGNHLWSRRFGGSGMDDAWGIALDGAGNAYVTGHIQGTVTFDGFTLAPMMVGDASTNVFVASLDGANGNVRWARGFGDVGQDIGRNLVVMGDAVVTVGDFSGTVEPGGPPLSSPTSYQDAFIVAYDTDDGAHLWSVGFGSGADDWGIDITADAARIYASIAFTGSVQFGEETFVGMSPSSDFAIVTLDQGGVTDARAFGSDGHDGAADLDVGADGHLIFTGWFHGTAIDFGGGPRLAGGNYWNNFVVKLAANGTWRWDHVIVSGPVARLTPTADGGSLLFATHMEPLDLTSLGGPILGPDLTEFDRNSAVLRLGP